MAPLPHSENGNLIIFAPGIHTGGGVTLLNAILESNDLKSNTSTLFLDARYRKHVAIPQSAALYGIEPSLLGRLKAEWRLRQISRASDTVICLHSLPPLFRISGHTICFIQNILHLGSFPLRGYPLKTRLRLSVERILGFFLRSRIDIYIVQTNSMKRLLESWHRANPHVVVCPFAAQMHADDHAEKHARPEKDFVYVADGLAHKNHRNLIQAWILLAEQGIYPTLSLTLTARDARLHEHLEAMKIKHNIKIDNCAALSQGEVYALYRSSRALIFPSFAESLGLPLVEASQLELPILASELDYVRDVCRPVETFDPTSPHSIARAVRRFLSIADDCQKLYTADTFLRTALQHDAVEPIEDTP